MSDPPSHPSPNQTPTPNQSASDPNLNPLLHWCYHCDKRVAISTSSDLADVICDECNGGFVESLPQPPRHHPRATDEDDTPLSNQFLQVLRLIAQAAREEEIDSSPPPPPSSEPPDPTDSDFLGFDFGSLNENNIDDENNDEEFVDDRNGENRILIDEVNQIEDEDDEDDDDEDENDENNNNHDEEEEEEEVRRWRDMIRRRLIEEHTRRRRRVGLREGEGDLGATRRNRILDWAEILLGLEDNSIELRLQMPEVDSYIGNPGDYVDAAGYEELLQNLAESDGGRRGAPPASKKAVEELESVVISLEEEVIVCAVCKDMVNVGECAKKLACGHRYHGDCIVPWLSARNSCPICRFELPTDDQEYEEERKKARKVGGCSAVGGSSSNGIHGGGFE